MSTAITSLISLVVMLVIAFTALGSVFTVIDATGDTLTAQHERTDIALRSDVVASDASTLRVDEHSEINATLVNQGALSYALFSRWDVAAHYTPIDGTNESAWAPYATSLANDSWIVQQIYLDADTLTAEVLGPGLLNPEEEAQLRLSLEPPAKPGSTGRIVITPPEGSPTNISFTNPTSLYVVDNDDQMVYLYHPQGTFQGTYALDTQNGSPRGITTHTRTFYVVDTGDEETYQYLAGFSLLGSWPHTSGNTSGQGITTDGSSSWVVDGGEFISETPLRAGNRAATGITTHGPRFFVADDSDDDTYRYASDMYYLGAWPLATGNGNADGITTNGVNIWVIDGGDDSIYSYDMNMNPVSEFSLTAANTSPAGIAAAPR